MDSLLLWGTIAIEKCSRCDTITFRMFNTVVCKCGMNREEVVYNVPLNLSVLLPLDDQVYITF